MSCAHNIEPLANAPFQIRTGAAWLMDFCTRCGERHWYVRSPYTGQLEDQPLP